MTSAVTASRMERLVEALRAYEAVPAPATTAALAAGAGVTRFAAYDLLRRLERQGRVWSILVVIDGRMTRKWHLKEGRQGRCPGGLRSEMPEAGAGFDPQQQRAGV